MKISNICSYIDFEDIDIYSGIGSYVRIVENPNSLRHPFVILKIIPTTQIIGGKNAEAINAKTIAARKNDFLEKETNILG